MKVNTTKELIDSLKKSTNNLDLAQKLANIGHWELDLQNNVLLWSDQVYRIFGLQPQEIEPSYELFLSFVHPADRELVNDAYTESVKNKTNYQIVHKLITKNGTLKYVEERCEHTLNDTGEVISSLGTVQDVTKKVENDKEVELASKVFTYSNDAIIITDKENKIINVNSAFERLTGYDSVELIGQNPSVLGSGWGDETFYQNMWKEILENGIWKGEIRDKKRDGTLFIASETIIAVKNPKGEVENYIGISSDITELVTEQKQKQKILNLSNIGDLKNRNSFLLDSKNEMKSYGALIDINAFHQINDFYGYEISDNILNQLSTLLTTHAKNIFKPYHLHADTFVLKMVPTVNLGIFLSQVNKIIDLIENHIFIVDEYEISISITVVIADGTSDLLNKLDMGLKYAKENNLQFWHYDESSNLSSRFEKNLFWIKEIKSAFREDRVIVYFQPIYSYDTKKIERYEALVRLLDNDGNIITPNHFLDAVKLSNQMSKLTQTVFLKTLETLKKSQDKYSFSINISTSDMKNSSFLSLVEEHLSEPALAKRVCFEILETEDINDVNVINHFVHTVHQLGSQVAIDDFGSGYANFENLIKLDIDIIKIDGTLVEKIATEQSAYDIVYSIVSFAQKRKIKTIAEFVKNRSIYEVTRQLNIDYIQGYYIDKPRAQIEEDIAVEQIESKEPYKLLIYVSTSADTVTYEDATNILNSSWRRNRESNIGGVLFYDKKYFVQMLNGPKDKIDQTYLRIKKDERHHSIRLIGESVSHEIEFDEWNMSVLPKSDFISDIFKKYNIQEGKGMYRAEFEDFKALLAELSLSI